MGPRVARQERRWKNTSAVVQTALVPPYVGSSERATRGSTRNASAAARNATVTKRAASATGTLGAIPRSPTRAGPS